MGGNSVVLIALTLVNREYSIIPSILSSSTGTSVRLLTFILSKIPARHHCSQNARTFSSGDALIIFSNHVDIL